MDQWSVFLVPASGFMTRKLQNHADGAITSKSIPNSVRPLRMLSNSFISPFPVLHGFCKPLLLFSIPSLILVSTWEDGTLLLARTSRLSGGHFLSISLFPSKIKCIVLIFLSFFRGSMGMVKSRSSEVRVKILALQSMRCVTSGRLLTQYLSFLLCVAGLNLPHWLDIRSNDVMYKKCMVLGTKCTS